MSLKLEKIGLTMCLKFLLHKFYGIRFGYVSIKLVWTKYVVRINIIRHLLYVTMNFFLRVNSLSVQDDLVWIEKQAWLTKLFVAIIVDTNLFEICAGIGRS